ncbi:MAG: D-sedoheptulose-7-phosphate isomerase [Planctomycetota bacterium]|jgi:D-sedoheptulose 7-phosphate isomerase
METTLMQENTKKQITAVIEAHKKMVGSLETSGIDAVVRAAEAINSALNKNHRAYICGNGGSAADAQHIAGELVGRFQAERTALPAIALTTDTSVITSIANDYGYENVFVRQAEALVEKGDIFWALSTSGASPNIVAAAESAKAKGACVLAFTGRKNTPLERIADICFCADSDSAARSQEIHQLAYHLICELVEKSCCQ